MDFDDLIDFGSVCSGIEAASVAFAPFGWEAAWLSEIDVAASQVLAYRYGATAPQFPLDPDDPGITADEKKSRRSAIKQAARMEWGDRIANYGDFTVLPQMVRDGLVHAPTILCGGTPCQAFSVAGRREGLGDLRGQLTLSFVDLADAIDERRAFLAEEPCVIYWENVPGVLSDKFNAFGCFLAALVGDDDPLEPGPRPERTRSSAYWAWDKKACEHRAKWPVAGAATGPTRTIAWRVQDAQYFGLAQRRRRVVLIGSAREEFDPAAILFEFEGVRRDSPPSRETGEGLTHAVAPCLTGSGRGVERTGDPRGQDRGVACERRSDGPARLICLSCIESFEDQHGNDIGGLAPYECPRCGDEAALTLADTHTHTDRTHTHTQIAPTWWDGSPVSQTLDAVLHKGQTMPEKNRFPAVLQPVVRS